MTINNELPINREKLSKVGLRIKEAREKNFGDIEPFADKLQIDKARLIALENGDEKNLPENVYIIGMVRRVSEALKLNADQIIDELTGIPPEINEMVSLKESISFLGRIMHFDLFLAVKTVLGS